MKLKRIILFLLCSWLAFIEVCPCSSSPTGKKVLHFAVSNVFDGNYDPVERNQINLSCMFNAIYSPLFRLDSRIQPYPFLVESYERNGKMVIFHIRDDARFSDGSSITSADVIASLEAGMVNPTYANPVYKLIEGGETLFQGKTKHCTGLIIRSPKTFEIHFLQENVEFSHYFATVLMSILPKNRQSSLRFTGPYQVVNQEILEKKTIITLQRNPWYIGKKAKIDTIYFHFYPQHADFEKAILQGEPDLFLYNRGFQMPYSRYKYNYYKTPSFGGLYFKLNAASGPFKDKQLRIFFRDFILSQNFAKTQDWLLTSPANKVLPYSLMGYFVFNPIKPGDYKALMPSKPVTVKTINYKGGFRNNFLPLLQEKLAPYNVNLVLEWGELTHIQEREKKRDLDLTSIFYVVDIPLSSYFYENLFTPGHELNLFGYEVPAAIKLLDDYRKESNELKKLRILSQLEEIAQDECILVPLVNPLSLLGYKDHVSQVSIDKFLHVYFEDMDVQKRN